MSGLSRADLTSNALLTLRASASGSAPNTSYQVMPYSIAPPPGLLQALPPAAMPEKYPAQGRRDANPCPILCALADLASRPAATSNTRMVNDCSASTKVLRSMI
jgi:hypothetical protein